MSGFIFFLPLEKIEPPISQWKYNFFEPLGKNAGFRCRGGMGQVADCDFGMTAIGFIHIESWIVSITATRHESINPVVMAGTNFVARLDLVVRQGGLFEQDFGNRVSESAKGMNKDILARAIKSNVGGDGKEYKGFRELRLDVKSFPNWHWY